MISREGHLPLLLVFLGVIGGVLAFGFIGIFLGLTLLALMEWSMGGRKPAAIVPSTNVSTPPEKTGKQIGSESNT